MGGALAAGPLPLWATAPSGAAGGELLPPKRFVIGHRGACAYAPENTLPSYRLAIWQGVEYVEQDLQITEAAEFAAAIGPYKRDINSTLVEQAHARRLRVVGYTFRAGDEKGFQDVGAEMRHYLDTLGIDAVFTDNPDQFPR